MLATLSTPRALRPATRNPQARTAPSTPPPTTLPTAKPRWLSPRRWPCAWPSPHRQTMSSELPHSTMCTNTPLQGRLRASRCVLVGARLLGGGGGSDFGLLLHFELVSLANGRLNGAERRFQLVLLRVVLHGLRSDTIVVGKLRESAFLYMNRMATFSCPESLQATQLRWLPRPRLPPSRRTDEDALLPSWRRSPHLSESSA